VVSSIRDHRFHWEGRTYQIGASIGLAPITAEAQDTAQLLTWADIACYTAKELGRNRVHIYQQEDNDTVQHHNEILGAAELRDSLEQGRFRLHYQPIVPLSEPIPKPIRYEALLRVVHKGSIGNDLELVLPAVFIPAAERYGLMGAIDRWVIEATFREYNGGIAQTGAKIAINLSGNSLSDETMLDFIETRFAKYHFPPEQVCFEITETAAIKNLRRAIELMEALKRHGSQFALDDFGSGLSSFHYLKTLPIDYLKIDGSFIKDMVENPNDRALVAAINQMSHTLGIKTVAEYVENFAISQCLREIGVDYAQGYFFGRPEPWDQ
jgi:EAL domain-containing protein (putative c-di-GMP-specific phosphodiesterase class I)